MATDRSSTPPPLQQRRDEIRRGLSRVNTAGIAVVLVTLVLAVAAGLAALRAGHQTRLAQEANEQGRQQLWRSLLAQARAGRLSRVAGSRAAGLDAVAAASAIQPSVELRNEAIAHLALFDIEPTGVTWTNQPYLGHAAVDRALDRFLESDGTGTVRVRPVADGNSRSNAFTLRSTNGQVQAVSFSAEGGRLCLVHANRRAVVWDLTSRTAVWVADGVSWAGLGPERDELLVVQSDGGVRLLDAVTGEERGAFAVGGRPSVGVFAVGREEVAVASQNRVHCWNWRTGETREPFETDRPVTAVAWHGHLLAAGDGSGEVRVWNLLTQRSRRLQAHQDDVHRLVFDPRGEVLASTSYDGSTKFWEPRTGRLLFTTTSGFAVQFSPDGHRVLFTSQVGWSEWRLVRPAGLRLVETTTGGHPNVWHADFSPDGRWLAATKDDGVGIFETATGRRVFRQPIAQARTAWFLPGETHLLTTSTRRIAFWPIEGGSNAMRLGARELVPLTNVAWLEPGALSWDRRQLIIPWSQTELRLFDLETRREIRRLTNAIVPKLSSISADGRWIATGTFHGRGLAVWEAATGQRVRQFSDGNCSAYFSPDGRFLVSAGSTAYSIHEVGTWRRVAGIPRESGSDLPNLGAFTADGRLMAAVKELNRIELLAPGDWTVVAALVPPDPQVVTWPVFSGDGRWLAVGTSQDLVQLWDLGVIRRHLAGLGLDWEEEARPGGRAGPAGWGSQRAGASAPGGGGTAPFIVPLLLAVLVVLGCAVYIRARQRRLLATYLAVDELAEVQKGQLSRAQAELVHSQKMKAFGNLAAGIAHDVNNLLSVIRMSNQLTGEAAAGRPDIAENVAEVEQAVQQGRKLVRSMLGYSRHDPEEQRPCAVPEVVEDTVGLLSKQFLGGIVLSLDLDRDTPLTNVPRSRLEQVLLNLVVNASEAMAGQGTLRLRVRPIAQLPDSMVLRPAPAATHVELSVADSGPGIAPDVLPRIFEPFFTSKHRGAEQGTGLGLSTVYTMAEQDGVGIAVESAPGRGATFRLFIPAGPAVSSRREE